VDARRLHQNVSRRPAPSRIGTNTLVRFVEILAITEMPFEKGEGKRKNALQRRRVRRERQGKARSRLRLRRQG